MLCSFNKNTGKLLETGFIGRGAQNIESIGWYSFLGIGWEYFAELVDVKIELPLGYV